MRKQKEVNAKESRICNNIGPDTNRRRDKRRRNIG